jgi:geranylgeranyl diphosphate synthase type I
LVKCGYECVQNKENTDILDVAIAFEYFQTAILAHDDIIDQSPLRRGKPTIYHELGNNHYGISQTICLGDIGFFIANQIISNAHFDDHLKVKALSCFNKVAMETGYGQMLDILLPNTNKEKHTTEDIFTIYKFKTGIYTISGPLRLGAILAGAEEPLLEKLDTFGIYLGIAFQIQDDILGIYGNEEKL